MSITKDKVTIVSPVYNTPEKYLNKLIKTVYAQTFGNVDLIFVDDGSQEHTVEYLKKIDKKYDKVTVIYHPHNKGCGEARKTGFRAVKDAEYVMECDPDDCIAVDAVEHLYNLAKKYGADVVTGGAQSVLGPFKLPYSPAYYMREERSFSREEIVNDLLISFFGYSKIPVAQWAKLYHKSVLPILSECVAVTDFAATDETVVLNIFAQANSLAVTPKAVYYYRQGGGSSQFREKYFEDVIAFYNYRKPFIEKYLKDYRENGRTARDYMDIELKNETYFILNKFASANKPSREELCKMAQTVLEQEEVVEVFKNRELKSNYIGYDEAVLSGDYSVVADYIENAIKNRPLSRKIKEFIFKLF